jgi:glycerol-3-phosphate dehydrogenase
MKSRTEYLQVAPLREFDLLVIGGGIAGAGVAQNAASRGLSVLVIEKDDFASGTSSRTTKLIHGGLRYLEQFRFNLTRQLCQERALLERLAPHMVRDFSFVMPLLKGKFFFNLKANAGLAFYDFLAWSSATEHHYDSLGVKDVLEAAPSLSPAKIAGGLRFHDCITDDSRIVLSVIKSACHEGGLAINYLEARSFLRDGNQIRGVVCHDRYTGDDITIKAKTVVNATGVWTDNICKMADENWAPKVTPSKGTHIIVPPSAFETNTALFLPTGDNRYVFVVPWQRALMIGTTDHAYSGRLENPLPTLDEIDYLLHIVNSFTQTHQLNRSDITATFAGLRPLVRFEDPSKPGDSNSSSSDTSSMSREHLIFESEGGLINVAGGKLTSYRLMAEEVMQEVLKKLALPEVKASRTDKLMLGGWTDKQDYLTQTAVFSTRARKLGLDPATIDHIVASYAADTGTVLDIIEQEPTMAERICADFPALMAEVVYCVSREMAVCLEDLLFRRLRLGFLNQKQTLESAPKVAALMQELLGWDNYRTGLELSLLEEQVGEHLDPLTKELVSQAAP